MVTKHLDEGLQVIAQPLGIRLGAVLGVESRHLQDLDDALVLLDQPADLDPRLGLICDARTPVEDLEKHLKIDLVSDEQEEDIDTLGGVVFSISGRIPARGELVAHPSGIEFEVLDADPRRIKKLRVHVPKDKDPANAGTGTDAKPEQSAP